MSIGYNINAITFGDMGSNECHKPSPTINIFKLNYCIRITELPPSIAVTINRECLYLSYKNVSSIYIIGLVNSKLPIVSLKAQKR